MRAGSQVPGAGAIMRGVGVQDWVGPILSVLRPRRRRVTASPGRTSIELRPPRSEQADPLAAALSERLGSLPGVVHVDPNPVLCRVVVDHDDSVSRDELLAAVEDAEVDAGTSGHDLPDTLAGHPADAEPVARAVLEVAGDVIGIALAGVSYAVGLPRPVALVDVAAAVTELQNAPPLRRAVDRALGAARAELALAAAASVAQGLAGNVLSPVVGATYHSLRFVELQARRAVWRRCEHELHPGRPVPAPAWHLPDPDRVVPLPDGPVETSSEAIWLASIGVFVAGLPLTGGVQRSLSGLAAGYPKAARLGREAFAGRLVARLCAGGVVVLHPEVARVLDRVDAAVFDAAVADPAAAELAREVGLEVEVVASGDTGAAVTRLQREGRVVLAVGDASSSGLASADCAVGVVRGDRVPWVADVLVVAGALDAAGALLGAVPVARRVSHRSAVLTVLGAVVGTGLALGRVAVPWLPTALTAVDLAALVAIAGGVADAERLPLPAASGAGAGRPPLALVAGTPA